MHFPLEVLLTQLEGKDAFWACVKCYELLCDCLKIFGDELTYKNSRKNTSQYLPNITSFWLGKSRE